MVRTSRNEIIVFGNLRPWLRQDYLDTVSLKPPPGPGNLQLCMPTVFVEVSLEIFGDFVNGQ